MYRITIETFKIKVTDCQLLKIDKFSPYILPTYLKVLCQGISQFGICDFLMRRLA